MKKSILIFLAGLLSQTGYSQVSLGNYALTGATIIDAHHRKPVGHQTILIRGGAIDRVFEDGSGSLPEGISVIDVKGKYIIPGLIDTHVHLATDPSGVDNRVATLVVLSRML